MNVSFNLNYLLVFGLVICIIVLIFMLFKYIFVKDTNSSNHNITGSPNEKNLQSNIDFFNTTAKIIEKSNKIVGSCPRGRHDCSRRYHDPCGADAPAIVRHSDPDWHDT